MVVAVASWAGAWFHPEVRVYRVSLVSGSVPRAAAPAPSPPSTPANASAPSSVKPKKADASLAAPPGPKYVVKKKKNVIAEKKTDGAAPLEGHLQEALERIRSGLHEDPHPSGKGGSVYESTIQRLSDLRFSAYYGVLWDSIKQNWSVPGQLPDCSELTADIGVEIAPDGAVATQWLERPSKNMTFNYAALKAVMKSNPFPAPPRSFGQGKLAIGFRFICS